MRYCIYHQCLIYDTSLKFKNAHIPLESLLNTLYKASFRVDDKDVELIYKLFFIHSTIRDIFKNIYHGSCLKNALDASQDFHYLIQMLEEATSILNIENDSLVTDYLVDTAQRLCDKDTRIIIKAIFEA